MIDEAREKIEELLYEANKRLDQPPWFLVHANNETANHWNRLADKILAFPEIADPFKAGQRAVVEWVEEEFGGYIPDIDNHMKLKLIAILISEEYGETGSLEKWQSKKKEWGVEK